jgi:hypothetical protein
MYFNNFLWQSMSYKVNLFVRDIYGLLFETKELKFYWLSFTITVKSGNFVTGG